MNWILALKGFPQELGLRLFSVRHLLYHSCVHLVGSKQVIGVNADGSNARPETHRVTGFAFKNVKVHGCMSRFLAVVNRAKNVDLNPWRNTLVGSDTDYQKTVGNALLEAKTFISKLAGAKQRRIDILHGVDALVQPGEMLVVLGPPGSGCSTFLKTITGEEHGIYVNKKEAYQNYRGISSQQMIKNFRGEVRPTRDMYKVLPKLIFIMIRLLIWPKSTCTFPPCQ